MSFWAPEGIDWSFIPERALHFSGLWESAVKSVKRHISRVVSETNLTFEKLHSLDSSGSLSQ